jgi:hypothetical protein
MKKTLFFLCTSILLICSCSENEPVGEEAPNILIEKIISSDGKIQTFRYSGNRLDTIVYDKDSAIVYSYSGELISKAEILDSNYEPTGKYETYSYSKNTRSKKYYHNNILIKEEFFTYNLDRTFVKTIKKYNISNNALIGSLIEKNYLDLNGNIIKKEKLEENNSISQTDSFTYDDKNGMFRNLLLSVYFSNVGKGANNLTNHQSSSGTNITYTYQYNDFGYPISSTETKKILNINKIVIYNYFYIPTTN